MISKCWVLLPSSMLCNPKYPQSSCTSSSELSLSREIGALGKMPDGDTMDKTRFMVLLSIIQVTATKNWREETQRTEGRLSNKFISCEIKKINWNKYKNQNGNRLLLMDKGKIRKMVSMCSSLHRETTSCQFQYSTKNKLCTFNQFQLE